VSNAEGLSKAGAFQIRACASAGPSVDGHAIDSQSARQLTGRPCAWPVTPAHPSTLDHFHCTEFCTKARLRALRWVVS
jgi:hypothetical protein